MDIYSGEVLIGRTGIPTELRCSLGKPLFTGDIVIVSKEGCYQSNELSAVVGLEDGYYAMGIKNVCIQDPENLRGWEISKVKDHAEVVDGEHWEAYGFSYRASTTGAGE